MEQIKAVVVDDNHEFLEALENMLADFSSILLVGKASSVEEGKRVIEEQQPDVVFLDVELNDGLGFDLLKSLDEINFEVVFTTAYSSYALDAIKFSAIDYLLKPFGIDELSEAIEKIKVKNNYSEKPVEALLSNLISQNAQNKKLGLATHEGVHYVELKDIIRCRADGNYTEFYITGEKKIVVSSSLKKYMEILQNYGFFRVHSSHLINLNHVKHYLKAEGGTAVMTDGAKIDIARTKKSDFLNLLNQM